MIDGRPSDTAFQVAAARAAHLKFAPPPHLLEDVHAESLLDSDGQEMISLYADDASWILLENRLFLPLRARYVEDRLATAYARGIRQFVILGAGLDSFAWRQPEALTGLTVYEVDHPSTQSWKRRRLDELGWSVPENTRLVPCDFETSTASEVLHETDFDRSAPTVVSWMGVIYYLERATADAALADLARLLAPGSEVVFDSMLPWDAMPARYQALREAMQSYLEGAGEPQVNRYLREEIVGSVKGAGFARATVETPVDLARRYAAILPPDAPMSGRFMLVVAER